MNSVENLKSTQWRKFFKLFKSSSMQCLNIFGARGGFLFEITSLSGVWKFCKSFNGSGPHVSDPFPFDHTGRSPSPARHPCFQWPRSPHDEHSVSVAAGRRHPRGLPPPLPLHRTSQRKPSPTSPFPSHRSAVLLAALLHTSRYCAHRCPSPMSCLELSDQAKRSASSPRPSCTESLPAVPAGEAGPRDFPVIVFLHERHTSGSLLCLFPLLDDPAAISAPPRSSSPTSSSTTSTTPSAPHRRPHPINTCATAEASSR
jgi:hypothetical protein